MKLVDLKCHHCTSRANTVFDTYLLQVNKYTLDHVKIAMTIWKG